MSATNHTAMERVRFALDYPVPKGSPGLPQGRYRVVTRVKVGDRITDDMHEKVVEVGWMALRMVLVAYAVHTGVDGTTFVSNEEVAAKAGVSTRKASDARLVLRSLGLLVERGRRDRKVIFHVVPQFDRDAEEEVVPEPELSPELSPQLSPELSPQLSPQLSPYRRDEGEEEGEEEEPWRNTPPRPRRNDGPWDPAGEPDYWRDGTQHHQEERQA